MEADVAFPMGSTKWKPRVWHKVPTMAAPGDGGSYVWELLRDVGLTNGVAAQVDVHRTYGVRWMKIGDSHLKAASSVEEGLRAASEAAGFPVFIPDNAERRALLAEVGISDPWTL